MDSLLSNAQRCARKADSLASQGSFEDAFVQLDKSISFLNDLKKTTSNYETIQILNVQIESVDRKMRSIAIKRSEIIQANTLKKQKEKSTLTAKSNLTNSLINHSGSDTASLGTKQKQLFYRSKTITGVPENDTAILYSIISHASNQQSKESFFLPLSRLGEGGGVTLKNFDPSTSDDDQDQEDEEFYEKTLKKTNPVPTMVYNKNSNNSNNSTFELNNTRSSTLTSSSSCSSAFSSMSNLNTVNNEAKCDKNNFNVNEATNVAIDLSKYLKDDDDDDESNEENEMARNFNEAANESFDDYFASPAKGNAKNFKPNDYIIE